MKNKAELVFGIILCVVSIALALIGAMLDLIMFITGMVLLLVSGSILTHWSTLNYNWVCDECGENVDLTFKQRISKINGNAKNKKMYCPNCQKETKFSKCKKKSDK